MKGSSFAFEEACAAGLSGELVPKRTDGNRAARMSFGGEWMQRLLILITLAVLACAGMLALFRGDARARQKHALAASLPAYAVDRLYAHQDGDAAQYQLALASAQHAVTDFNGSAHSESEMSLAQTLVLHMDYAKYCRWRTQNDSRSAIQETWRWCTDAHQNFEKLSEERVREIAAGK